MNTVRRKEIGRIVEELTALRGNIEAVLQDEEQSLDGVPENMNEKREQMESYTEMLQGASDYITEAEDNLNNCLE